MKHVILFPVYVAASYIMIHVIVASAAASVVGSLITRAAR